MVSQITGINVRETVPDFLLDRADEIELIDLPPDDLLQRLREGKVYMPEQAAAAIENFFRKGNLIALRELALRRTADRVDEQMQVYRQDKGIKEIWPAGERILVCVGHNPRSIRLIHAARRLAAGLRAEWIAVHVEAPSQVRSSEQRHQAAGRPHAARGKPRRRERDALGAADERRDPHLCAQPERDQDHRRQADPCPLEGQAVRLAAR